jgi:membrane-bound metal-dependent hydrolase YbcI (DUF457 family)
MSSPQAHPREKSGFHLMIAGFFLILLAGVFYYILTEHRNFGHVLFAIGLVVYIVGRVFRSQGRARRERGEKG